MVNINLLEGDCIDRLKELDDDSIDSIVTDPPYGLSKEPDMMEVLKHWINGDNYVHNSKGFMGKNWDSFVPNPNVWKECLRVLKPGGHMVAFFGTRTYDMGVLSIRIAGFEIRDQLAWVFSTGFPKSLNISKAIDKMSPIEDKLLEFSDILKKKRIENGLTISQADDLITGGTTMYSFLEGRKVNGNFVIYKPSKKYYNNIVKHFGISGYESIIENSLEKLGTENGCFGYQKNGERWNNTRDIVSHTTEEAKQWDGWGTALKPAYEPIVLARKPLSEKTVASNVLKWGTGGLNIDASRVPINPEVDASQIRTINRNARNIDTNEQSWGMTKREGDTPQVVRSDGRFPANLIHDGSDEVVSLFPESKGQQGNVKGTEASHTGQHGIYGEYGRVESQKRGDTGSAARFFYAAKASKCDKNEGMPDGTKNNHITVKPYNLMKYLVTLVTPPNGTVLDPFMGSGSTGKAAVRCGFNFVGIELDPDYLQIAKARIEYARDNPEETKKSKPKKDTQVEKQTDLPSDLFE